MGRGGPYFWKPYPETNQGQHQWAKENIQTGHGALGKLYPDRFGSRGFLEGGGTTPWIGLVNKGLYDPEQPSWRGWGGRFTAEKQANVFSRHDDIARDEKRYVPFSVFAEASDRWTDPDSGKLYDNEMAPVWRWRRAAVEDFKCRMDWCVQPPDRANHNPVAVIDGDATDAILRLSAKPGDTFTFDASGSRDPDRGQTLSYWWWIYPEPGAFKSKLPIEGAQEPKATLQIPAEAAGAQIHLVLDVSDDSPIASMHDYRRIVVDVTESAPRAAL